MNLPCNKTNSSRVMTIINSVWRWLYELKNIDSKNQKALTFSKIMI